MSARIICGDALDVLRGLDDESVDCCVTSPPYWGLRDYGAAGQLGLEPDFRDYVARLVEIMREVRRVLRDDGTLWLNLGDSYVMSTRGSAARGEKQRRNAGATHDARAWSMPDGLKPKDLAGIPWRVAFALQDDGWWLRADIVWSKPNPMPESVTDRPTKAHEYVFLLAKSQRYYYDAEAIKEPAISGDPRRPYGPGVVDARGNGHERGGGSARAPGAVVDWRNRRSVWEIVTAPYPEAHFATFPTALVEPCVLAGSSHAGRCHVCGVASRRILERVVPLDPGRGESSKLLDAPGLSARAASSAKRRLGQQYQDQLNDNPTRTVGWTSCGHQLESAVVLDPFAGAGTTGLVALRLGRSFVGIELNAEYCQMAERRLIDDCPMFNRVDGGARR